MGGAGRKRREGCVETENEEGREGGRHAVPLQPPLGFQKDMFMVRGFGLLVFDLLEKLWQLPKTHLLRINRWPCWGNCCGDR